MRKRQVIVVLGMHRSGTSAIARGLKALGVELGDNLMPPIPNVNEKGFWEDLEIYGLNEEVLATLRCNWHSLRLIEPEELTGSRLGALRLRAVKLLSKKFGQGNVFGFKDPRVCKLLPFWQQVFDHLKLTEKYVISLRNPLSVEKSLAARNGFSPEKSHLLWLEHVIPSLSWTQGKPRVVIDYDLLMNDPVRQMKRVAAKLEIVIDKASKKELALYAKDFLEENLRHTRFEPKSLAVDPRLPELAADTYRCLLKVAADKESPDTSISRNTWRRIEQTLYALAPVYDLLDKESQSLIKAEQNIVELDGQLATLNQTVTNHDGQFASLNQAAAERDSQIASLNQVVAERDGLIASLNQGLAERDGQVTKLKQTVAERDMHIAALSQAATERDIQITALNQAITERDGQIASLNQAVAERDGQIAALNEVAAEREGKITALSKTVAKIDGQIAALNHVVAEREGRIAALDEAVAERNGQIASLNQSVVDLTEEAVHRDKWALRLDSELKESQSKLMAVLRSNSWRVTLPLREARRWVDAPRAQSKRYAKAALRRLKRAYQALPLSAQTKALHRNWVARHAPCLLLASGAHPASIPTVRTSAPVQPRLLPVEYGASTNAKFVENIVLPTSDSPIVSVIVPVCGNIDYTLRCLKSIENHPPRVAFEVIVVDDCSPDSSAELLSKVSGVRLTTNTENLGFIRSCNAGAKAASGEYLLFLNNDTEVTPDWMDKLLRTFDEFPGKVRVKIAAVTMVYNEALILPYFLRHYRYLDEIHVLYETDSTDESLEILMQAPNVVIEKGHIEGGLDDIEKINLINKAVQRTKANWVYVVDTDEFVFPPKNESPHNFLKRQSCDVVRSGMFQVYRHRNDRDLDPALAPVPQRTHGDPDLFSTDKQAIRASNSVYIKPNIVRPSKRIRFLPGHHQIEGDPQTSPELYVGAHWQMADPSIAIARRMERKARMSERNRAHQMGWQNFDVSVDKIKEECERHLDDPIIDALCSFSEVTVQDLPSGTRSDNLLRDSMASLK